MTAAARNSSPPKSMTPDQRRAIFAAAKSKGKSIDDIRDMCPKGSISMLTYYEAWDVLNQLNGKPRRSDGGWQRTRPRAARREPGIISRVTPEQLAFINLYRIALGWMPSGLHGHLNDRKYPSDPSRKMTDIQTTADGQAVIEHLKIVLSRTLFYHAKRIGNPIDEDHEIKDSMRALPPHEKLTDLFVKRAEQVARIKGFSKTELDEWIAGQRFRDGRYMSCTATCADVAHVVQHLEKQLPLEAPAKSPSASDEGTDDDRGVIAKIGGA